jgi:predicted nucleic acid-binding protein
MASRFIDTNILLYAAAHQATNDDEAKRPVAQRLIAEGDFATSAQVLQEFYANAIKLKPKPLAEEEAEEWVELLARGECVPVDTRLVREGVAISRRFRTSYWDGAIIAAAHAAGTRILFTEDLNHGQTYGQVQVINPFKPSTH